MQSLESLLYYKYMEKAIATPGGTEGLSDSKVTSAQAAQLGKAFGEMILNAGLDAAELDTLLAPPATSEEVLAVGDTVTSEYPAE